jgi:hypothetical protein
MELSFLFTILSIPQTKSAVPGTPIANGARRTYGAKKSNRTPIIIDPKQNASHETSATIESPHIADPAIKHTIPVINLISLLHDITHQKK